MRVGFPRSILWSRYGQFWTRLVADAGAEVVYAGPQEVLGQLSQNFLQQIPSTAFRLATAESLVLADCDVIVVPHPNAGTSSTRGAGQDPWASEFPDVLATTAGLNNVFGVPVLLDATVEPLAVTLLQRLLHDGWRNRMIMERHQSLLKSEVRPLPTGSTRDLVAVVGQPWLVDARLASLALPDHDSRKVVDQSALDPRALQEEGRRVGPGFAASDQEVLGAVHWFSRRGDIARLVMLLDDGNEHDRWLLKRAGGLTGKAVAGANVQDLLDAEELHLHLLGASQGD